MTKRYEPKLFDYTNISDKKVKDYGVVVHNTIVYTHDDKNVCAAMITMMIRAYNDGQDDLIDAIQRARSDMKGKHSIMDEYEPIVVTHEMIEERKGS